MFFSVASREDAVQEKNWMCSKQTLSTACGLSNEVNFPIESFKTSLFLRTMIKSHHHNCEHPPNNTSTVGPRILSTSVFQVSSKTSSFP